MMKRLARSVALLFCVACFRAGQAGTAEAAAPTHDAAQEDDPRRGWHFYDQPEPLVAPTSRAPEPPAAQPPSSRPPRPPELAQFKALQQELEERRNIAIISPTEHNVRRYMELEAQVVSQASTFADVAQRIAWATPELDMTLRGRPVNAQAIEVFDRNRTNERAHKLASLATDHVLFFFFRSDCPYCHAMAPMLAAFPARYGMGVVAISVDGGGIAEFPDARPDNGIARTLRVAQVPALFLAAPYAGTITALGFGVLSETQILERIDGVSTPQASQSVSTTSPVITLQ